MADLSQYSDEELMAIAGLSPQAESASGPDLSSYSDDELMKIAGIESEPTFSSEWEGIKKRGAKGVGDLLTVAENIVGATPFGGMSFFNPERQIRRRMGQPSTVGEYLNQKVDELGIEDPKTPVGQIAGEVAYYAPGLFTPGGLTKTGIASVVGGGLGAGVTKAAGGSETAQALTGLGGSFLPNVAAPIAKAAGAVVGKPLEKAGLAMQRKSLGTRASDYVKSAENARLGDINEGEYETLMKRVLNEVIDNGELGNTRNPGKMLSNVLKQEKEVTKQIGTVVTSAEKARVQGGRQPVFPELKRAKEYVLTRVPVDEMDSYAGEVQTLDTLFKEKGNGSLPFLQQQKVNWGDRWELGNDTRNGFYQAVYLDLKDSLEKAIPGIKDLNRQEQKWMLIKPILKRSTGAAETATIGEKVQQIQRTSGGQGSFIQPALNALMIGGAGAAGGAALGPIGLLGGAGLVAYANSNAGRNAIGSALKAAGRNSREIEITLKNAPILAESLGRLLEAAQDEKGESEASQLPDQSLGLDRQAGGGADVGSAISGQEKQGQTKQQTSRANRLSSSLFSKNTASLFKNTSASNLTPGLFMSEKPSGDVDLDKLVKAVATQESDGNAKAVSSKGAKGLMQLTPLAVKDVANHYGLDASTFDYFNKQQNKEWGTKYLQMMLERFGDIKLALAAYNMGPTQLQKFINEYETDDWDELSKKIRGYQETKNYVPAILKKVGSIKV